MKKADKMCIRDSVQGICQLFPKGGQFILIEIDSQHRLNLICLGKAALPLRIVRAFDSLQLFPFRPIRQAQPTEQTRARLTPRLLKLVPEMGQLCP